MAILNITFSIPSSIAAKTVDAIAKVDDFENFGESLTEAQFAKKQLNQEIKGFIKKKIDEYNDQLAQEKDIVDDQATLTEVEKISVA